jgi:hypothetical protein
MNDKPRTRRSWRALGVAVTTVALLAVWAPPTQATNAVPAAAPTDAVPQDLPVRADIVPMPADDVLAIQTWLAYYARYYDDGNVDAYLALFTDDATFNVNGLPLNKAGYDLVVKRRLAQVASTQRRHAMTDMVVDGTQGNPDQATLRAYFAAIATDRTDGSVSADLTGSYAGTLVKVNGLWLGTRWQIVTDGADAANADGVRAAD